MFTDLALFKEDPDQGIKEADCSGYHRIMGLLLIKQDYDILQQLSKV